MNNNIFSNSPFRKDFFRFAFEKYSKDCDLFIAVPFFTYVDPLLKALENNCSIKLIVRICPATNPDSLRRIFKNNNVAIRFFTSNSFHPKLYIFGNNQAILGSSNLTQNGFMKNQEINILINSDSDDFVTLQDLFNDYWNYAEVLTEETLNKFENLNLSTYEQDEDNKDKIITSIGDFKFPDIVIDKVKTSKSNIFASKFLKEYQIFLKKYSTLKDIFAKNNKYKVDGRLSIRFEIDQFLNWIRSEYAIGDSFENIPEKSAANLDVSVTNYINEYILAETDYIYKIEEEIYPLFKNIFGSKVTIHSSKIEDLVNVIGYVNAFYTRFRYYESLDNLKEIFLVENGEEKIKKTIEYLIFGEDNYQTRIGNCIYRQEYKLAHFGSSCVKEFYGWINADEIPLCNDRTLKTMQWLGFGKLL